DLWDELICDSTQCATKATPVMDNQGNRESNQSSTVSFVVRIWLERGAVGEATWRGRIRHVQSGRDDYFQGLAGMREVLEREAGVAALGCEGATKRAPSARGRGDPKVAKEKDN
ncbi:MAG: hypothetical protein ACE5Q3_19490, partial [Alphaproteobacteria bacterium]